MISEPRQRMNARRGFTLLELILAGSIAVLVLVTVTTSLSRIGQARVLSQDKLVAYLRADSALQNLRRDAASTIRDSDLFHSRVLLINNSRSMNVGGNNMDLGRDDLLIFAHRLRPLGQIEYNGEGLEYETQYRVDDDQIGPADGPRPEGKRVRRAAAQPSFAAPSASGFARRRAVSSASAYRASAGIAATSCSLLGQSTPLSAIAFS